MQKARAARKSGSGSRRGWLGLADLLHFGNVALQLARPCMAVLAHHVIFDGHFGIVIVAVVACLGRAMDIGVRVGIAVFFGVA